MEAKPIIEYVIFDFSFDHPSQAIVEREREIAHRAEAYRGKNVIFSFSAIIPSSLLVFAYKIFAPICLELVVQTAPENDDGFVVSTVHGDRVIRPEHVLYVPELFSRPLTNVTFPDRQPALECSLNSARRMTPENVLDAIAAFRDAMPHVEQVVIAGTCDVLTMFVLLVLWQQHAEDVMYQADGHVIQL
jgi:hypothetical protein